GADAVGVDRGAYGQLRRIDMTGTEHMGHRQVPGQQMVGDEPAVAAPTHGVGAHEYAARGPAPVDDGGEVGPDLLGQTVVGIVVETAVVPPGIGVEGNRAAHRPTTGQSAEAAQLDADSVEIGLER